MDRLLATVHIEERYTFPGRVVLIKVFTCVDTAPVVVATVRAAIQTLTLETSDRWITHTPGPLSESDSHKDVAASLKPHSTSTSYSAALHAPSPTAVLEQKQRHQQQQ
jgi:hypothetical protein